MLTFDDAVRVLHAEHIRMIKLCATAKTDAGASAYYNAVTALERNILLLNTYKQRKGTSA